MKINNIKNLMFKHYSIDNNNNNLINTIYIKYNNLNKKGRLLWSYYRDRYKINANDVIEKYNRNLIIINYSIETNKII